MRRGFVTTRPTRAPEGSTKHGKEQPVPVTAKSYQMVKTIDARKKLHQPVGKITSQHHNGRTKFTHNNTNVKCKWAKCPSKKTQTGKLDKESRPIGVLYSGTQSQNKGMEEDLPSKWKEKKKAGLAILVFGKTDFKPSKIKRDKGIT